jgi:hypothetical protein
MAVNFFIEASRNRNPYRMIVLPSSSHRFYLAVLLLFVLSVPGCANLRGIFE